MISYIPEIINFKMERFLGVHSSGGISPWSCDPVALGLWQVRTLWEGTHGRAKPLTSWCLEAEKERGLGPTIPPEAYADHLASFLRLQRLLL